MKNLEQFKKIFDKVKPQLMEISEFDETTCKHSISVALLTFEFMQKLSNGRISNEKLEEITIAAFLHDIGKLDCPVELINGGSLTPEERKIVNEHANNSKKRLEQLRDNGCPYINDRIINAAVEHHETENGKGYPLNKTANEISYYAKVLHVVDIYEALLTERSYKAACSEECALAFLLEDSGEVNGVVNKQENKLDIDLFKKFIYMTSSLDLVNAHLITENLMAELGSKAFDIPLDNVITQAITADVPKTYDENANLQHTSCQAICAYRFNVDKELIESKNLQTVVKLEKAPKERKGLPSKSINSKMLKTQFKELKEAIENSRTEKIVDESLK